MVNNSINYYDPTGCAKKRSIKDILSAMHKDPKWKKPNAQTGWDHKYSDAAEATEEYGDRVFREKGRKRGGTNDRGWRNKSGGFMSFGTTIMVAAAGASFLAIAAADNLFSGQRSAPGSDTAAVETYFRRMQAGDQAFADLDLITLALEQTGGDALGAMVMFDVLDNAGQFFAELGSQ